MSQTLSQHIPAPLTAAVETALEQTFGTTSVTDISLLAGGLSASPVFKITVKDESYVLKLGNPGSFPANLKLAADAGVAPPLHYHNTTNGISISGLINNKPLRNVLGPEKLPQELAATIRTIHNVPYQAEGIDLQATINDMIAGFRKGNILSGPVFDECFSNYDLIKNKYPWNDKEQVFSHNDLNPSNVLCDGERIWIIDWDVSSLNDRYIDLANAANFFVYGPEEERIFLDTYFDGAADDYKAARFYIMRQVGRIIYSMLMFQLAAQAKPKDYAHNQEMEGFTLQEFRTQMGAGTLSLATYEGQFLYGKALLNEAVHQMRTPRFAAALATIS